MLLIADTSPLISLLVIDQLQLLDQLFEEYYLPKAVWDELNSHNELLDYSDQLSLLSLRVKEIHSIYVPMPGIDVGETEAIILCKEMQADILLVDDKKAREVAELLGVICTGTLAVLLRAHGKRLIKELRPLFMKLLEKNRYYSKILLNQLLEKVGENKM